MTNNAIKLHGYHLNHACFRKRKSLEILGSVTDSHSPATRPTPTIPVFYPVWGMGNKKKKEEERNKNWTTKSQQSTNCWLGEPLYHPLIGAISRYQPPPLPINVHYARNPLPRWGACCLLYFEPSSAVPKFLAYGMRQSWREYLRSG